MHLTLSFFGQVGADPESELKERIARIQFKPFFLPLAGVGMFSSRGRPAVIWAGVGKGHPHLFQLHKRVQEAALGAGLALDLRAFHPHVTIARCRNVSSELVRPWMKRRAEFDGGMVRVEEFVLFSSQLTPAGSLYTHELIVRCS
jgi:2'-5' RNA ligase